MKKLCLFSIIISFVLVSTTVYSAERALLGNGSIAVKLDYITFTDNHWSGQGDDGLYVGLLTITKTSPVSGSIATMLPLLSAIKS